MRFLNPSEYQRTANSIYASISRQIRTVLPNATVQHVGSSSVAGLISKGDLDVYVGVDRHDFKAAIETLTALGFNIKKRTLRTGQLCPFISKRHPIDVGIQLVERSSKFEFF